MFLKQTKSFPSMASSSINSFAKHPYPSEFINVMDFVPIVLLVGNYKAWKQLMLSFIKRLGMVGFIDGTFEAPPHMVTVPDSGGGGDSAASSNTKVIENLDYIAWKRSDNLVQGWILTTISREIGPQVLHSKTAREIWIALERIFDPLIVKQRLCAMFWEVAEKIVPQLKQIRENKLVHHQGLELVQFICTEVAKLKFSQAARIFTPALLKATSVGIHEIVEKILELCPSVIGLTNPKKQSILQYATVCRCENMFNLIYQLEDFGWLLLSSPDSMGNNGLHLAGCSGLQ